MPRAGTAFILFRGDFSTVNRQVSAYGKTLDRQLNRGTNAWQAATKKQTQTLQQLGRTARFAAGGVALLGGIAVVKSIGVAADFEQQVSRLGAVSDASAKQLATLKTQALAAGAATKFSALDAAAAQTELAKGGLSVQQIMGGGLKAALGLAAAGELELADASRIAVNAIKLFGLSGKDAGQVADAFATAANKTTADVGDFGLALAQGGAAAKAAGFSFTETVAALEALAEVGVKGADAGTSLKTSLAQLAKPTAKSAAAMKQLGIDFFDAHGNMKPLTDIAALLQDKLGGLTKEQRLQAVTTIAGTDGMRTLLSLYEAGPDKIGRFEKGLQKQGTAADVAAKKQDNLRGKLENFRGSIETLQISVGTQVLPVLSKLAERATKVANTISKISTRKDLDFGEKVHLSLKAIDREFGPDLHKLDIPGKLAAAFSAAVPKIAEAAAKAAPKAVRAFFDAWRGSNLWGKLIIGGFLLHKLGGFAAFRKMGLGAGGAFGKGVAAGAAPGLAATRAIPAVPVAPVGRRPVGAPGFRLGAPASQLGEQAFGGRRITQGLSRTARRISPAVRGIGASVLGVALFSGIADAATSKDLDFGDRVQRGLSTATLGIVPDVQEISERFGLAIRDALQGGDPNLPGFDKFLDNLTADLPAAESKVLGKLRGLRERAIKLFGPGIKLKLDVADPAVQRDFTKIEIGFNRLKNRLAGDAKGIVDVSRQNLRLLPEVMDLSSRKGRDAVVKNMRLTLSAITSLNKGQTTAKHVMEAIRQSFVVNSRAAKDTTVKNFGLASAAIDRAVKSGLLTARQGLKAIRGLFKDYLGSFGIKGRAAEIYLRNVPKSSGGGGKTGGVPLNYQRGGLATVPGTGSGDKVAARVPVGTGVINRKAANVLLEPGEKLVPPKVVQKMGGPKVIHRINRAVPRFQEGGVVQRLRHGGEVYRDAGLFDGHPANVAAGIKKLIGLMKGKFPALQVTSTTDHSRLTTSGNVSDHSTGHAVDLASGDFGYMNKAASFVKTSGLYKQLKQGIHNPNLAVNAGQLQTPPGQFAGAVWAQHANHIHLAVAGALRAAIGAAVKQIGRAKAGGPDSALKAGIQAGLDRVRATANATLSAATGQLGGMDAEAGVRLPKGQGSSANRLLGKRMAAKFGWGTGPEWGALDDLWGRLEGSWDENLANLAGSGAYGIAQALPASKYPTAGEPGAPPGVKKAQAQIGWGLRYIKGRYGDPLAAHAFRLANNYYARGGIVGMVGDSLGVGTAPYLKGRLGGKLKANVLTGRSSASGVGALRAMLGKRFERYILDLGTNDPSAGALSSSVKKADKLTGGRLLLVPTVNGPKAGSKNAALHGLAHGDINLFEWARRSKGLTGPDGIHAEGTAAYGKRAAMMAGALAAATRKHGRKKGKGQALPGDPDTLKGKLRRALGRIGQQAERGKPFKMETAVGPLLRNIKKLGLPKRIQTKIAALAKAAARSDEFATRASELDVVPDSGATTFGKVGGSGEARWLGSELSALFQLRNTLVRTRAMLIKRRDEIAKALEFAQKRAGKLSAKGHTPHGWKGANPATDKIREWNKQPAKKRLAGMKEWRRKKGNLPGDRHFEKDGRLQATSPGQRRALARLVPALKGQRGTLTTTLRDDIGEALQTNQGFVAGGGQFKVMPVLPPPGVLGGELGRVQLRLRELGTKPTATDSATAEKDTETADLLRQMLREANLRTAVAERQFDVFRNFPPFGGQFAQGGVVPGPVGAPRMVLAHGQETITPPGQAAAGDTNVHMHFKPGTEWLRQFVQVEVEHGTRKQARKRPMPGQGGGRLR